MLDFLNSSAFQFIWDLIVSISLIFVFGKMGLSGWAAIIPLYGDWCLYDRIWGKGLLVLAIQIVAALIFPILAMAIAAATYFMMFKGFGKSTLFCILGAIFAPIGIVICAFDSSTFCG